MITGHRDTPAQRRSPVNLDTERLKQAAPFALPLMIVVLGWMFLISPTASENAGAARQLDALEQRLAQVRASVAEPPPPPVTGDPHEAFERQVAAHDVSSQVILQLSQLASSAAVTNLAIETGDRVIVTSPAGPQVSGGAALPDPRFALFEVPLAYSPILMSFDADYAGLGGFLWRLRDLSTTMEVRSLEIRPRLRQVGSQSDPTASAGWTVRSADRPGEAGPFRDGSAAAGVGTGAVPDGRVHAGLTLFAYARRTPSVVTTGVSP